MIRPATEADLAAICALQVSTWRETYRGLLPESFLTDEVERVLGANWASLPGADWIVLTAWKGRDLAGFIAVERSHDGGPYVDNLHVSAAARGQGVARALMAEAAGLLVAEGYDRLHLTVMDGNDRARAAYARLGGVEAPAIVDDLYGIAVRAYPVWWRDLSRLAAI